MPLGSVLGILRKYPKLSEKMCDKQEKIELGFFFLERV